MGAGGRVARWCSGLLFVQVDSWAAKHSRSGQVGAEACGVWPGCETPGSARVKGAGRDGGR
eukprot:1745983-Pyramimonas_sp.AAC.1